MEVGKGKAATVAGDMALSYAHTISTPHRDYRTGGLPLAELERDGWGSSEVGLVQEVSWNLIN